MKKIQQERKGRFGLILVGILLFLCFVTIALMSLPKQPQPIKEIREGVHFERIADKPLTRERLVVFFWYGCPHCLNAYESMSDNGFFERMANVGIRIRRVPVPINPTWTEHARLYHALNEYGMSMKSQIEVMRRIQSSRARTVKDSLRVIKPVLEEEVGANVAFSVTGEELIKLAYSDKVTRKVDRDMSLWTSAGANGVPAILVDGQFLISASQHTPTILLSTVAETLLKRDI